MAEQTTYTTEQIMEQAQVFASAWSLVGGCFDSGDQLEVAKQEKTELRAMLEARTAPSGVPATLPCDVMLPPATIIRRGCDFNILLNSLGLREGKPDELCTIQRARPAPTEQLWAVHAQGPDELWAAESREEAEQHAAALNALPGQTDTIKVNAVVIPSPWSEVEHWKTLAEQWRHEAEDRIASLQSTRAALDNVTKVARSNLDLLDENTALRSRVSDLLHLLQYATITTPSTGDAEQAKSVMGDLARMLAAKEAAEQPSAQAARDVLAERRRQVEAEGWTPKHDDEYCDGQMSAAAASYALDACGIAMGHSSHKSPPAIWPWAVLWWKPAGARRNLVKAAALILAEIERLDRALLGKEAADA